MSYFLAAASLRAPDTIATTRYGMPNDLLMSYGVIHIHTDQYTRVYARTRVHSYTRVPTHAPVWDAQRSVVVF